MKKLLFLVIFFLSVKTFADAGYAYRFYIKAEVKGKEVKGYFYHYSYEQYNETIPFYNYLKETSYTKKLKVYKSIATINLGLNYDFVVKDSHVELNFSQTENIKLVDYLYFPSGDRLIELNKDQFNIISQKEVNYIFINNEGEENIISENCSNILISTNNMNQLKMEKEIIKPLLIKKVKDLKTIEGMKEEPYFKYFNKLQKDFLGRGYLLISVCSAL